MKSLFLVVSILIYFQSIGQQSTYFLRKDKQRIYLVIEPNSVRLLGFNVKRYSIHQTINETITNSGNKTIEDCITQLKSYKIESKNNTYFLVNNSSKHSFKQLKYDTWKYYEKEAFESKLRDQFLELKDSLSYDLVTDTINPKDWEYEKRDDSTDIQSFSIQVQHSFDSLSQLVQLKSNPVVQPFYTLISSQFNAIDSIYVFNQLSQIKDLRGYTTNYINSLTTYKPEWLIRYVDHNPENLKIVCKSIRTSPNYKALNNSIKNCPYETDGKSLLLKQYSIRKRHNALKKTIQVSNIVGQALLTTLVLLWIF